MSRIIAVTNMKGGVSKTSTGVFLATALAKKGRKVVYLDCDDQASAYKYRQYEKSMECYQDTPEPYRIRRTDPTYIFETVQDFKDSADIIFIDLPRLTETKDNQKAAMMLTICDSILIPIPSGELDNMSTQDFVEIVKRVAKRKQESNRPYLYAGFASRTGRIPTGDRESQKFMQTLDIPILQNELKELKQFASPYTYDSLFDVGKKEKKAFEPFFNEVIEFFNL